jgi:leucyl aminopeptidase
MKFDCGGAAAILGAAKAIAQLSPDNIECHFVVAACEVRVAMQWKKCLENSSSVRNLISLSEYD